MEDQSMHPSEINIKLHITRFKLYFKIRDVDNSMSQIKEKVVTAIYKNVII